MVTSRGWWDLADHDQFYPDDLPEDWRLGYFANQFRATLLPAEIWTNTKPTTITQWRDEVPAGFRFVAEQSTASPAADTRQGLQPRDLVQGLGSLLDGWLEPFDAPTSRSKATALMGFKPSRCLGYQRLRPLQNKAACPHGYAVIVPTELYRDLRHAKDWLRKMTEHQGQAPGLIILARPSSNDLMSWQTLLELLGMG